MTIRWQLPLSYAGIAFLAALSLGVVLLTVLRSHYTTQERNYLETQARSHSRLLGALLQSELPTERVEEAVGQLAFLSDSRLLLLDAEGETLADSGVPRRMYFELISGSEDFTSAQWQTGTVTGEIGQDFVLETALETSPFASAEDSFFLNSGNGIVEVLPPRRHGYDKPNSF